MDLFEYFDKYQDKSLKEEPFNEIDALIFSSLAYPKYQDFLEKKKSWNALDVLYSLKRYDYQSLMKRKQQYIELLKRTCSSKRFEGIKLVHFVSHHDEDIDKQFQAISFVIDKLVVVSFCGTDGTTVGLKEDMNMSYLDITPSELEAIEYLKIISKQFPRKQLIIVGHSKGGRLAITSAKFLENKEKLVNVYSFDAPNYQPYFYDDEYKEIDHLIKRFVPEESIIGRLISEPFGCRIVKSTFSLLMQHDTSSWVIENNHFCYLTNFTKRSTKIVNALNSVNSKYGVEVKKEFSDALFGFLEKLEIKQFSDKKTNLAILKEVALNLPGEWKNTPKEERKVLKDILLTTIVDFIKG